LENGRTSRVSVGMKSKKSGHFAGVESFWPRCATYSA
jgi:hypothetical protein